jgi:hypothetical protein
LLLECEELDLCSLLLELDERLVDSDLLPDSDLLADSDFDALALSELSGREVFAAKAHGVSSAQQRATV